ncbi:hypothetical protein [Solimicrobium silvestre]|uniref:Uncharacterized protein n=1 Tax=Solimicrobium silvestre TaxID=2099400 RepID=A0A2S9H322_9BURK|nr:hypothetical protein [Solimicrobium silvestre]PRC94266.1 hypothetical protein S2091_0887 [Solimicrobium silvestre]
MNLVHAPATKKSIADFDDAPIYQTQFKFMSVSEHLNRIVQRIKNFNNKTSNQNNEQPERCSMLYFSVDAKRITEARRLIISMCRDKLIFMRVKPMQHATTMQVELFLKTSVMQHVQEMMESSFQC